jgi:hypothetical protein
MKNKNEEGMGMRMTKQPNSMISNTERYDPTAKLDIRGNNCRNISYSMEH